MKRLFGIRMPRFEPVDEPTAHLGLRVQRWQTSELQALLDALPELQNAQRTKRCVWLTFPSVAAAAAARDLVPATLVGGASFARPTLDFDAEDAAPVPSPAAFVAGFRMNAEFIDGAREAALLAAIDARPWDESIHRRTQHYGRVFEYDTKTIGRAATPIPAIFDELLEMVCAATGWPRADQITVNEYLPGMGIAAHVETHAAFDDGIGALTLGTGYAFRIARVPAAADEPAPRQTLWLAPRSLLTFAGAARYEWTHAIPPRKSDRVGGERMSRGRRVSVTMRRALEGGVCRCAFPHACTPPELPGRIVPAEARPRGSVMFRK